MFHHYKLKEMILTLYILTKSGVFVGSRILLLVFLFVFPMRVSLSLRITPWRVTWYKQFSLELKNRESVIYRIYFDIYLGVYSRQLCTRDACELMHNLLLIQGSITMGNPFMHADLWVKLDDWVISLRTASQCSYRAMAQYCRRCIYTQGSNWWLFFLDLLIRISDWSIYPF